MAKKEKLKLEHESKPNSLEWLLNYADAHHQLGDTEKAIACLKDAEGRFCEEAEYLFRLVKYHAILGNVEEAKNLVRRVFKKMQSTSWSLLRTQRLIDLFTDNTPPPILSREIKPPISWKEIQKRLVVGQL